MNQEIIIVWYLQLDKIHFGNKPGHFLFHPSLRYTK